MPVSIDQGAVPVPFIVGKASTTGANAVAVSGSHAFVADGSGGLAVVDVSNPQAPKVCTSVPTYDAQDVAVAGSYAYVADDAAGLKLIDISTPCSAANLPPGIPSTAIDAYRRLVLSGSHVFALTGGDLVVIDVSSPSSPQKIKEQYLGGYFGAAASSGSNLFAIGSSIAAINVSNPGSPVTIHSVALTSPFNEAIAMTAAIPTLSLAAVVVGSGIELVDASTPSQLKKLGAKPSVNQTGVAIRAGGGRVIAYVSTQYYKLERWEITDPALPTRLLPDLSLSYGCSGIALGGTRAYLACGSDGLLVLDGILP